MVMRLTRQHTVNQVNIDVKLTTATPINTTMTWRCLGLTSRPVEHVGGGSVGVVAASGGRVTAPSTAGVSCGERRCTLYLARRVLSGAKQQGLRVDFVTVHWYGDCTQPTILQTFLAKVYATYNMPMWLTELSRV